nr:MAG TPA: hypothetical protein [Caudoviricetes sp.]
MSILFITIFHFCVMQKSEFSEIRERMIKGTENHYRLLECV